MMDLRPYARSGPKLSDYLPWAALIGPGIILNKDGAFQRTLAFRGPDLDSATLSELMGQASRLNNALRRFGSGWCLHVEARRRPSPGYPDSDFTHGLAWLIDEERRAVFEAAGARFESEYFLTLAFLPPPERQGKLSPVSTRETFLAVSPREDFWFIAASQGAKMKQKSGPDKAPAERVIKDIRRAARRPYSAEEKIRIVLEGLRGEESIAEICRREGIASSMYCAWSKEFLEAGKRRLSEILCSAVVGQAIGKRPSNMMASWPLTACHSRTERFHSVDVALSAR